MILPQIRNYRQLISTFCASVHHCATNDTSLHFVSLKLDDDRYWMMTVNLKILGINFHPKTHKQSILNRLALHDSLRSPRDTVAKTPPYMGSPGRPWLLSWSDLSCRFPRHPAGIRHHPCRLEKQQSPHRTARCRRSPRSPIRDRSPGL